jgi:hypothetical protein
MAEMIEVLCLVLLELKRLEMDDVVGWVRSTGVLLRERREHRLWGLAVLGGGCGPIPYSGTGWKKGVVQ